MLESILGGNLFGQGVGSSGANNTSLPGAFQQRAESQGANPFASSTPRAGEVSLAAAQRYARSESFSLDLTTREGDRVTITFDHASAFEASLGATRDSEGGSAAVFNLSRTERNAFQFSVEGDLNDDELAAIQNLVQDVSLIANDFFGGDVQAAFERASDYRMDRSQLGSMALHMSRSEQYSAAAAYQQVQQTDPSAQGGQKLGHMLGMLNQQQQSPALGFVDQLASLQEQILNSLIEHDSRYQEAEPEAKEQLDRNKAQLGTLLNS